MGAVSEQAKAKHRKDTRELRQWYRDHGFCPRCLKQVGDGRVYCKECLKKYNDEYNARYTKEEHREYAKRRREKLAAAGMCIRCGKHKARENRLTCSECARKIMESNQTRRIRERIQKEAME